MEARAEDPEGWLDPFAEYNVETVLFQFAIALIGLIVANKWIVKHNLSEPNEAAERNASE